LERNIEKLKIDKQKCTLKLNLLRDKAAATSINNHNSFHSFDSLENRLFNLTHQIYELEATEKDRKKTQFTALIGVNEAVGDKICAALKTSLSLIVRLDALAEDTGRLKLTLEVWEASKNLGGNEDNGERIGGSNACLSILNLSSTLLTLHFCRAHPPKQPLPRAPTAPNLQRRRQRLNQGPRIVQLQSQKSKRNLIYQSHRRRSIGHLRDVTTSSLWVSEFRLALTC